MSCVLCAVTNVEPLKDVPTIFIPERHEVLNIKVGDTQPNCFGEPCKVDSIIFKGDDVNGKAFCGVYLINPRGLKISETFKEDRLHRTLPLSNRFTSSEVNGIEECQVVERNYMHY